MENCDEVNFSKEALKLVKDGLDLELEESEFHKRIVLGKKRVLVGVN